MKFKHKAFDWQWKNYRELAIHVSKPWMYENLFILLIRRKAAGIVERDYRLHRLISQDQMGGILINIVITL